MSLLSFCAHVSIILFALSLSLDSVRPTVRPSVLWCNIKTSYTESSEEGEGGGGGGGPSCIVYLLPWETYFGIGSGHGALTSRRLVYIYIRYCTVLTALLLICHRVPSLLFFLSFSVPAPSVCQTVDDEKKVRTRDSILFDTVNTHKHWLFIFDFSFCFCCCCCCDDLRLDDVEAKRLTDRWRFVYKSPAKPWIKSERVASSQSVSWWVGGCVTYDDGNE